MHRSAADLTPGSYVRLETPIDATEVRMFRMRTNSKVDTLREIELFAPCTDAELEQIASLFDEVRVPEGRDLTTEGRPGRECFLIIEGRASVTLDGNELAHRGPGDVVGELSLIDHELRTATVTALTPMHLYVLDPRSFASLIDRFPGVTRNVFKEISERLREAQGTLTY